MGMIELFSKSLGIEKLPDLLLWFLFVIVALHAGVFIVWIHLLMTSSARQKITSEVRMKIMAIYIHICDYVRVCVEAWLMMDSSLLSISFLLIYSVQLFTSFPFPPRADFGG